MSHDATALSDAPVTVSEKIFDVFGLRLCLFVAIAFWFLGTWWTKPYEFGYAHDWTFFTHHATSSWTSLQRYGQIPIWEPSYCGGIPALGNLQSEASSPDMLLTIPFGLFVGLRLRFVLLIVLGLEGAYRYARELSSSGAGAFVAAIAFALSGRFVQIFSDGQPGFFGFELLPWVIFGFERGTRETRYAMLGACFLAWIFAHGGAVATPICGLTLCMVALRELALSPFYAEGARKARAGAVVRSFFVLGACTAGLTMYRLLPVVESLIYFPRQWFGHETYAIEVPFGLLLAPPAGSGYVDPGTSYVGVVAVALALLAVLAHDKKAISQAVIFVAVIDIAMGEGSYLGIWDFIHSLPVLHNFRNPFRFTLIAAFFVAIGAARGLTLIELTILRAYELGPLASLLRYERWKRVAPHVFGALSLVVGLFIANLAFEDVAVKNHARLDGMARRPMSPLTHGTFQQSVGNRWLAHVWPAVGLGTLSCFEEQPLAEARALRGNLAQDEFFADAAGTVRRVSWSPHAIVLDIASERGGVVVVNQNAHRGFRASVGRIVPHDGLVAVQVPRGRHRLRITHMDPLVYGGMVVSLATLVGVLITFAKGERDRLRKR